jgi:hypothetical protein
MVSCSFHFGNGRLDSLDANGFTMFYQHLYLAMLTAARMGTPSMGMQRRLSQVGMGPWDRAGTDGLPGVKLTRLF